MTMAVADLFDLADMADDLETASRARSIDWMRWTPGVVRWMGDPSPFTCLRGGNGTGKSRAAGAVITWRATGTHPYRRTHRPPVKMAVYGYSHSALEAIMEETFNFAVGTGIDARCRLDPGRGVTGKPPRILWSNGSVLIFLTYSQSSEGYAGKTLHYQHLDEPCPASKWGEIRGRTRGVHGEIGLTLTPTPEAPPQDWLAEKCITGEVSLTVLPLCDDPERRETIHMEAVTPHDSAPWTPEPELWAMIRSWLPAERLMRCGLSWDVVTAGRQLDAWDPLRHLITDRNGPPRRELTAGIGIDHGLDPGRQAAVLGVTDGHRVWILDQYRPKTRTSTEEDAAGIISMLSRVGWSPATKLLWIGDRSAEGTKYGVRKSNAALAEAIAAKVGKPRDTLCGGDGLFIRTPNKPRGSVWFGLKLVNGLFREDRLFVHPRCRTGDPKRPGLVECIEGWEGDKRDPRKDLLDAARYLTEYLVDSSALAPPLLLSR